ncbi:MAG: phenylalanine--tRNA ligase subunit beta [Planctomycetota bacterium]
MQISLAWLNRFLDQPVDAEEAERLLTFAGFPLDANDEVALPSGATDRRFDVEVTSNRGDVLSHVGCAREIAAAPDPSVRRSLVLPEPGPITRCETPAAEALTLQNDAPGACPLFTAHVVRGVRVGPSPAWLVDLLESVGQRSINNVVDVTNFITFELGNPCHVFDLNKLAGPTLRIRYAEAGEPLTTLDGKPRRLAETDLVVADAERPQSLAGVIGGHDSEVDASTTDVVFEMATWDPVTIRQPARRLAIRTDASHRFERIVDPRTIAHAALRAVAMIQEVAGGEVLDGRLAVGPAAERQHASEPVELRPSRCEKVLGIRVSADEITARLAPLEIGVEHAESGTLRCTPPAFRPDLTREIDLIEEVARVTGYGEIPLAEKLDIRVRHPQESERNRQKLSACLTGLGFFETVTFSFVSPATAEPFTPTDHETVSVDDDRRGAEPTLRPSVLPSLLACRRANQDARVTTPGGLRLFELSAVFAQKLVPAASGAAPESIERQTLSLLMDAEGVKPGKKAKPEAVQAAVRAVRGAVDAVAASVGLEVAGVRPAAAAVPGFEPDATGELLLDGGERLGVFGVVAGDRAREVGLDLPVVAAELDARLLLDARPPIRRAEMLPAFPGIERDLSVVVAEPTGWADIEAAVGTLAPELEHFLRVSFVGTFRGEQVGAGKKSLTMRLAFRAPDRTLRHDEVNRQVERIVESLIQTVQAEIRSS